MPGRYGDSWKTRRDSSGDPGRKPRPVDLKRYELHPAYSGIGTFLGVPVCLTPDDLRAGRAQSPLEALSFHGAGVLEGVALAVRPLDDDLVVYYAWRCGYCKPSRGDAGAEVRIEQGRAA